MAITFIFLAAGGSAAEVASPPVVVPPALAPLDDIRRPILDGGGDVPGVELPEEATRLPAVRGREDGSRRSAGAGVAGVAAEASESALAAGAEAFNFALGTYQTMQGITGLFQYIFESALADQRNIDQGVRNGCREAFVSAFLAWRNQFLIANHIVHAGSQESPTESELGNRITFAVRDSLRQVHCDGSPPGDALPADQRCNQNGTRPVPPRQLVGGEHPYLACMPRNSCVYLVTCYSSRRGQMGINPMVSIQIPFSVARGSICNGGPHTDLDAQCRTRSGEADARFQTGRALSMREYRRRQAEQAREDAEEAAAEHALPATAQSGSSRSGQPTDPIRH
jgi:hypothetical protein